MPLTLCPVLQRLTPDEEGSSSDGDEEEDVLMEFLSLQPEELWNHMMQRNGSELQVGLRGMLGHLYLTNSRYKVSCVGLKSRGEL